MKKRNFIIVILMAVMAVILFTIPTYANQVTLMENNRKPEIKTVSLEFNIEWEKTFGGSRSDYANDIIQTNDGGYAISGYTNSKGAGKADAWVIKLDYKGNLEWEKTFGGSKDDKVNAIIQTNNGGYVLVGVTKSKGKGGYDAWIIKLDNQGNLEWDKTFGESGRDWANSIIQTNDGGYAIAGSIEEISEEKGDVWIIKLDRNGNKLWDKTFGGIKQDWANSIIQTNDGGYAIAGFTSSNDPNGSSIWVIKLDQGGNKLWDKTFGGSPLDEGNALIQTSDSGYLITGYTLLGNVIERGGRIIKLDQQGNELWNKTLTGNVLDEGSALIQTSDSGYLIAGYSSLGDFYTDRNARVIKLDQKGNVLWYNNFRENKCDCAQSIIQANDGSYLIAGYSSFDSVISGNDAWIVKFNTKSLKRIGGDENKKYTENSELTRIEDFSISLTKIDRMQDTAYLDLNIKKIGEKDSAPLSLPITLVDDHENEYKGNLNINLEGIPAILNFLPKGFIYKTTIGIKIPEIAPIKAIRFGDMQMPLEDINFSQPTFLEKFDNLAIKRNQAISVGKWLSFTMKQTVPDFPSWKIVFEIKNEEYNSISAAIVIGILHDTGHISWSTPYITEIQGASQDSVEVPVSLKFEKTPPNPKLLILGYIDQTNQDEVIKVFPIPSEHIIPFSVKGGIYEKWKEGKFKLGLPVGNEYTAISGSKESIASAQVQDFEGGRIYYITNSNDKGHAFEVAVGPLMQLYEKIDASNSWLGFPIKDQYKSVTGWSQADFEGGYIATTDGYNFTAFPYPPGKIAFASDREGNMEIFTIDLSGRNPVNLTNNPANDWDPKWSPCGKEIVFVSQRDKQGIYLMNADGSNQRFVTEGNDPSWFPDGKRIVFKKPGKFITRKTWAGEITESLDRIFIADANGTNVKEISPDRDTSDSGIDFGFLLKKHFANPVVSPDGSKIAFSVGKWESGWPYYLFVMNIDGTNLQRIDYRGNNASWTPDGQDIFYRGDPGYSNTIQGIKGYGGPLYSKIVKKIPEKDPKEYYFTGNKEIWVYFGLDCIFDGETIIFSGHSSEPSSMKSGFDIWMTHVDNRIIRKITTIGKNINPSWIATGALKEIPSEKAVGEDRVKIEDPNLEQVVREAIDKPTGPLHKTDLEGITTLDASEREIESLDGIQHLQNLQELDFHDNQVSNISPLSVLTKLQYLNFSYNLDFFGKVSDISPLSNLKNLQELWFNGQEVSNISPFSNLTKLEHLYFHNNQVSDISPLSSLTNLQTLSIIGNQVSDISSLSNLSNLGSLYFWNNQVADISPLSSLTNLQELDFSDNQVSCVSALSNLTKLERLGFNGNQVSDISPLSNLTNLQELAFGYNKVSYISTLANLINLQWLCFHENQVSDISPLSNLTNLENVELDNNQVSDISDLVNNKGLGIGDEISMQYNYLDLTNGSQDMQDIQTLIYRGVNVHYEPQSTP